MQNISNGKELCHKVGNNDNSNNDGGSSSSPSQPQSELRTKYIVVGDARDCIAWENNLNAKIDIYGQGQDAPFGMQQEINRWNASECVT